MATVATYGRLAGGAESAVRAKRGASLDLSRETHGVEAGEGDVEVDDGVIGAGREDPACEGAEPPRSHPSMRRHIFWALFATSVAVLVAVTVSISFIAQHTLVMAGERELAQECRLVAAMLEDAPDQMAAARGLALSDVRLTLLSPDGAVLYDSAEPASELENHSDRPEVREAVSEGEGDALRESETVLTVSLYAADLLENGNVVRLSVSRDSVLGVLLDMAPFVAAVLAVVGVACATVARVLARRLVSPLNSIDPTHPLAGEAGARAYAEVVPLLRRIDEQHAQIETQMGALADNDRIRIEFTANVTHELKTPLTAISGYAELIEAGIAAPPDVPEFARRIHEEATHLTSLVNDILTLSKMDEAERVDGALGTCEPVDLGQLASTTASRLSTRAKDADVELKVEGEPHLMVSGMSKLVDQIIYNLCDNALRYNRPGGTVTVACGRDAEGRPFVRVSDTGIGIAPENLEKVFNRFYRVDPSRSKETGGTGLGLAIVKHAARCHDALLDIESELGVGTAITVTFHAADDRGWVSMNGRASTF